MMLWTQFADRYAAAAAQHNQTWSQLIETLRHAGPYPSKTSCPWIKLATFGELRTDDGCLRHDRNLVEIHGIEGDYDQGEVSPAQAIALLEQAQIRACVYTSPSHTAEKPRWRVLAPLSHSVSPLHRERLLARVNGVLGGVLAGESFTASQSYFFGSVAGADYQLLVTFDDPDEGRCVDELDDLDQVAIGKRRSEREPGASSNSIASRYAELGRALRTGDGRRDLIKSYVSHKSNGGMDYHEIMALVRDSATRFFDPADPIDWTDVHGVVLHVTARDQEDRAALQAVTGRLVENLKARAVVPVDAPVVPGEGLLLSLWQLGRRSASVRWQVKHLVPDDSLGMIFGASGTFKSFLAIDHALHVAHGMDWARRKTNAAPVIYLAAEGGAGIYRRVQAWHQHHELEFPDNFHVCITPLVLSIERHVDLLVKAIEQMAKKPRLIYIDTLSQTFDGEENSATDISNYLRLINSNIRSHFNCTVIVIHHTGHAASERPRGSSAITANVDFMLGVYRPDPAQAIARVDIIKQKDGDKLASQTFVMERLVLGQDEDGEEISSLCAEWRDIGGTLIAAAAEKVDKYSAVVLSLLDKPMSNDVLRELFCDQVGQQSVSDGKPANRATVRKAYIRALEKLAQAGTIERLVTGLVRRIDEASGGDSDPF